MTNKNESRIKNKNLLYPELSYQIQGAVFEVSNKYGKGLKENIYQKALAEEFAKRKINFGEQKRINIHSMDTGKTLGTYVPDFIIDDKIILEIKATEFAVKQDVNQQQSYLKASIYEIAYLVNFCTPKLFIKRSIYTNDRKPFIVQINTNHEFI
jgi:GxxExxY protein